MWLLTVLFLSSLYVVLALSYSNYFSSLWMIPWRVRHCEQFGEKIVPSTGPCGGVLYIMHVEGILRKGPYPPCLRMADRALLAGYPRCSIHQATSFDCYHKVIGHWPVCQVSTDITMGHVIWWPTTILVLYHPCNTGDGWILFTVLQSSNELQWLH